MNTANALLFRDYYNQEYNRIKNSGLIALYTPDALDEHCTFIAKDLVDASIHAELALLEEGK
tara:strand:- start:7221 stop:7406 length:186 start_codon:yes stop_codon:yes gene_type:complete